MTSAGAAREAAPAKVNLVLHVGARGSSGLHELCSLFASIDLEDTVAVAVAERDEVVCRPPVAGRNLAADAVVALRAELGGELPPLRVEIDKRIPVAAGLAGGSADAAATLRAGNRVAGGRLGADDLRRVAEGLGSDVPSQVDPRHALVTGTGERAEPVGLPAMTLVLIPAAEGLATAAVYAEADRLGSTRERLEPERVRALADLPLEGLAAALENDLEPAATVLRPELIDTRTALVRRSALAARVTGSGPTVFGVFATRAAAEAAAADIDERALVVGLRG
jgi:4-diphosphocytidyl-2-C-methyl-D-erythritol kinase